MNAYISRKHRTERLHIAAARGGEKGLGKFEATFLFHLDARSRLADMGARAGSELAAGRRIALDRRCDLLESEPEHVVQQKGCPLERSKAFQRKHQRQSDIFLLFLFNEGIGKPGTNIGLALTARRFELIETKARDRAAQEGLGLANLAAVGTHPADECLLHHIFSVNHGAEHAVGHAHERRTQRLETRRCVLGSRRHRQAAAALAADFTAAGSAQPPKPTARRLYPLMTLIINVSLTCSSSVNSAFRA